MTRVGHASGCVQNLKCDYVAVCIEIQDNARLVLVALGDRGVLRMIVNVSVLGSQVILTACSSHLHGSDGRPLTPSGDAVDHWRT